MNWLASIFVGLCAAVLTAIVTFTAADSWAKWLHISTREGAAGYWVFMIGLLAAIVALVLGIVISRGWLLTSPNFFSALGATAGLTTAAVLVLTGIIWIATDHAPMIDGRPIEIEAELRFPPGTRLESVRSANGYATILRVTENETSGLGYFDFNTAQE